MAVPPPYPLVLRPLLFEKVWGGRALERFGKRLAPGVLIGESWEVADLDATSPSGGGGGAARSVIENGPLAGRTLGDALRAWGADLVASAAPSPQRSFPLLVKYLDARENLSVQVHPSREYAKAHPGAHLKTEAWYVLHAAPGAVIYKGVRKGVSRDQFRRELQSGGARIPGLLNATAAEPGSCHLLPSGTVHALGAGVVVAEVQTPSDTTFRVHDWGRTGRALHVEEAMECIDFDAAAPPTTSGEGRLTATGAFTLDAIRSDRSCSDEGGRCQVVLAVESALTVQCGAAVLVPRGAAAVVPAAVSRTASVAARGLWLRMTVPS